MAESKRIRIGRNKVKVAIGNLDSRISIHDKSITPPLFGSSDYVTKFSGKKVWALVNSVSGRTIFNGVDQDINVTHDIYVRFDTTISAQNIVELGPNEYVDVLDVEDFENRHRFLKLTCVALGATDKLAASQQ